MMVIASKRILFFPILIILLRNLNKPSKAVRIPSTLMAHCVVSVIWPQLKPLLIVVSYIKKVRKSNINQAHVNRRLNATTQMA